MLRIFRALPIALVATGAVCAADLPSRKPGLWEISTAVNGKSSPTGPMQQCIDAKTDDVMGRNAMKGISCSRNDVTRKGDRVTVSSVCQIGTSKSTTEGVFVGSFDSAYRADLKTTYDPPMMGMKDATIAIEAKWLGPCQAGQKPGDIIVPGRKIPGGAKL